MRRKEPRDLLFTSVGRRASVAIAAGESSHRSGHRRSTVSHVISAAPKSWDASKSSFVLGYVAFHRFRKPIDFLDGDIEQLNIRMGSDENDVLKKPLSQGQEIAS